MATKKRLIYTLLYSEGYFCQSRNFRCQKVGNYEWLFNNYKFSKLAGFLDELIIINVTPKSESFHIFLGIVKRIIENIFIPVTIGGGINSLNKALECFQNGADKILLNTIPRNNQELASQIINYFGSQSVIASVDYKALNNQACVYDWNTNKVIIELDLMDYIKELQDLKFGEILLNSVEKDGTGFGLDINTMERVSQICTLPLIVMGGAGQYEHFSEVYSNGIADAVSTANILNFIGDAIPNVRKELLKNGFDLAHFS